MADARYKTLLAQLCLLCRRLRAVEQGYASCRHTDHPALRNDGDDWKAQHRHDHEGELDTRCQRVLIGRGQRWRVVMNIQPSQYPCGED